MNGELTQEQLLERIGAVAAKPVPAIAGRGPVTAIVEDAAAATMLSVAEIRSARRTEDHSQTRFAIVYAARTVLGLSWSKIAQAVGFADHTTAISAFRRADQLRDEDFTFRNLTALLVERAKERAGL